MENGDEIHKDSVSWGKNWNNLFTVLWSTHRRSEINRRYQQDIIKNFFLLKTLYVE